MNKKKNKKQNFLEGPIGETLLLLAVPIIFSNILQSGYQLTDAFWVGRIGSNAIAAVAVSTPIVFLSISLGIGFSIAGSTLIAQYFGAKKSEMVNHVAAQTLLMISVVSVVVGIIGYLVTPWILTEMRVSQEVYSGALGFMRVSFIALIFNFFFFMFQSIMRGIGEMKLPVIIVMCTVLLNFFLDPLFIFGFGPLPALGVMGAALATVGTQALASLAGAFILFHGKYGVHITIRNLIPDFAFMKRVLKLGLPPSIEMSTRALGLTVFTFIVASFGTITVAAYGIGSIFLQVVTIPAIGMSMAVATHAGQNIGAGNVHRASLVAVLGAKIAFGMLLFIGVVVFVFAPTFIGFFAPHQEEVIRMGSIFIRIIALSWGFMAAQIALRGIFRASGNMMTTLMLALLSQWIIQIPIAYLLSRYTPLHENGLWWSFTITNVLIFIITVLIYSRGSWKTRKLSEDDKKIQNITKEVISDESIPIR